MDVLRKLGAAEWESCEDGDCTSSKSTTQKAQKKQVKAQRRESYNHGVSMAPFLPTSDYGDYEIDMGARAHTWEMPGSLYWNQASTQPL